MPRNFSPSDMRYVALMTARRAVQGLSDGRPQWSVSAAHDALKALTPASDFRLPNVVEGAAHAIRAAVDDCRGQRAGIVGGATLLLDAALAAEAGCTPAPARPERY